MRLTSVLILLLTITSLCAQSSGTEEKWIGLNNLFFKNKDMNTIGPLAPNTSALLHKGLLDKQFSVGLFFRKINKKKVYQQFDLFEIGWKRNKNYVTVHDNSFIETIRGEDIKEFNVLLGYQRGKLFPISSKLNGDIGIRGFAWYKRVDEILFPTNNFPFRIKSAGLGLNLDVGLNYQVHKRINIGYSFVPMTIVIFWNENYVDNPILPPRQKTERNIDFESMFFESIIGVRNFHISYVF